MSKVSARPQTGNNIERPMTTKAAGYSKALGKEQKDFGSKTKMFFHKPTATSKEQIIKELEKNIQKLCDESILLKCEENYVAAKDKCLTAYEKLNDYKMKNMDYANAELEFCIQLNLGLIYEGLKMYDDARQVYTDIIQKENYYPPAVMFQRVRVNLGNLYYIQGQYKKAITEWQKAVDKIPKENKEIRGAILKNIANAQIKLIQYTDAIGNYEESLKYNQNMKTCMNLLLSYLAVNEKEKTKTTFNSMIEASQNLESEIDSTEESKQSMDKLKEFLVLKKKENANIIVNISLVMTYYMEKDPLVVFSFIIDSLKKHGRQEILNEVEMAKAMYFLKKRDVEKTISIMKGFENKNKNLISRVSNNISFLYFVEGDYIKAESYIKIAIENERYNHKALVNMGNIHYIKGEYSKAKEYYLEAIGVQSDCPEAIYNLGMVNIRVNLIFEAIQAFEKLQSVVPNIPEVLYQIAKLYENRKQFDEAIKYYSILLSQLPNDPILLSSLGSLYYQKNPQDVKTYMHYFEESYRYFPSNFETLTILGFLNFRDDIYEKAIEYFQLAYKVNPNAYSAILHVARCYLKMGKIKEAFVVLKKINNKFPDNKEALSLLISCSRELGIPSEEYELQYKKLEDQMMVEGYPPNYYQGGDYEGGYYGDMNEVGQGREMQMYADPNYKGEMVDFSQYSSKNAIKSSPENTLKFGNNNFSPEELLP